MMGYHCVTRRARRAPARGPATHEESRPTDDGSPGHRTIVTGTPSMPDSDASTPTLYEWAGGMPAFERLTTVFYERVALDPLIGPIFAHMSADHPRRVAHFLAEVFRGPAQYTAERGGHATMLAQHLGKRLTQQQRARWVQLLLE